MQDINLFLQGTVMFRYFKVIRKARPGKNQQGALFTSKKIWTRLSISITYIHSIVSNF